MSYPSSDPNWLSFPPLPPPNPPYSSPLRPPSSFSSSSSPSPASSSPLVLSAVPPSSATEVRHQPHRPLLHLRSPTKARDHRQAQYRHHIRQQRNQRILDSRGGLDRMADDVMFSEFREWIHHMEEQANSIHISDDQLERMLEEEEQDEAEARALAQADRERFQRKEDNRRNYTTPPKKPLSRTLFGDPIKKRPRGHSRSLSSPSISNSAASWLSTSPITTTFSGNPLKTSIEVLPPIGGSASYPGNEIAEHDFDDGYQDLLLDFEEQELREQEEMDYLINQFSQLDHSRDQPPMVHEQFQPEISPINQGITGRDSTETTIPTTTLNAYCDHMNPDYY